MCFADAGRIDYWDNPATPASKRTTIAILLPISTPESTFGTWGRPTWGFWMATSTAMTPVDNGVPLYNPVSNPYGWTPAADQLRKQVGLFDLSANDGKDTLYNYQQ